VRHAARHLIDPLGRELAATVEWWELASLEGRGAEDRNPKDGDPTEALSWPVAVVGQGQPLLLLHGFDSCFLEFRRLVPLLAPSHQLFIPDLFGFGFSPRPAGADYSPKGVLAHLEAVLAQIHQRNPGPVGLIGASMGGSAAVELARRHPEAIARLLLLSPAGLTGRPMPVPPLLDALGVRFLALPGVRRGLCRSAFADPDQGVGPAELEIASLHLASPGWAQALGAFARSGGFAGSGSPLPPQPLQVLWGQNDRILRPPQKRAALALLGDRLVDLADCGHLPHIDQPVAVAKAWPRMGDNKR
jgi:pimeloyl-ACP methyl ester carboxylesterase